MIARIWCGVTAGAECEESPTYLNESGVPDYRATEGNRGVYVMRRVEDGRAHFLTLSFWESIDDIKRFAGPDPERARYYPEDEKFLLGFEPTVGHYEVVVEPSDEA